MIFICFYYLSGGCKLVEELNIVASVLWPLRLVKKTQCKCGWWLQIGRRIEHCSLDSLGVVASETNEENPMQIPVVVANWWKN
jgi:hypothetical protein